MNKFHTIAALAALMSATALCSAQADDNERWPRWYIGIAGGYTFMSDQDVSGGTTANKMSFKDGGGIGASIGYLPSSSIPILNNMRFEGEVSYHRNKIDNVSSGSSSVSSSGNFNTTAYMINAFYDLPTGTAWSPYIGAGMGVAELHLTNNVINNSSTGDNEFAYQGLVGIGYTPETIPDTQWTLGYRYLATANPTFGGNGPTDVSTKYATSTIEVGAKFRF